jgi:hypothetical protein
VNTDELKLYRFLKMHIYLSSASDDVIASVTEAASELVDQLGFSKVGELPAVVGSWWKQLFIMSKEQLTAKEVTDIVQKALKAAEIKYLDGPQAEIDGKAVDSVIKLLNQCKDEESAIIRIGRVMLLKQTVRGKKHVAAFTLTTNQFLFLEKNPALILSPTELLDKLTQIDSTQELKGETSSADILPLHGRTIEVRP